MTDRNMLCVATHEFFQTLLRCWKFTVPQEVVHLPLTCLPGSALYFKIMCLSTTSPGATCPG